MKKFKRKFLKLLGMSYLTSVFLPYNLLFAVTKKIINPDLTREQKKSCSMKLLRDHSPAL